jgi:hypothetical protein
MITFEQYVHDAIKRKPKVLYHVTFGNKTIDNIKQNGLLPKLQTPQNFYGVFFTRTRQKALAIGRSIMWRRGLFKVPMFVLSIDSSKIPNLFYDGMYLHGLYTTDQVPADAIISIDQVGDVAL